MAPRVDFYVLPGSEERARLVYACRLVEKAYLQDCRVYVHAPGPAEAEAFDELLWTFADRSFVPHELAGATAATGARSPVVIGCTEPAEADLLVNLAADAPACYERYPRIAEFVDAEPARRDQGRRRFAWYRERGLAPETHKLAGNGDA
jgi:DNA polymerase III subunit chi